MNRIKVTDVSNLTKKLDYTLQETGISHVAKVSALKLLPSGEFVEVELGTNKILQSGFRMLSLLLYNKTPNFTTTIFEDDLYAGSTEDLRTSIHPVSTGRTLPYISSFNVSYDGAQGDGVIKPIRHKNGWDFSTLIPFRVIPTELNDFSVYKQQYLHHRKVNIQGREYIEYYSKIVNITVTSKFTDGSIMPDNPALNATTDLDSNMIAEFPVNISDVELVEHWRLRKEEGAEGAHYNSTMVMIGTPSEIELGGVKYPTLSNSVVFSKSNHVSVAHGVDAFLNVKYQMLHV